MIRPTESETANAMPEATEEMKLVEGEDFYWEGAAVVFTERYHLRRGRCCESGCRHCPYRSGKEDVCHDAITTTTDEKSA